MFRNSLVDINQTRKAREKISARSSFTNAEIKKNVSVMNDPWTPKSSQDVWKYLGEYKKNILLIVRYTDTTHLPDEQLNFLISVLGACRLDLGDIAILNIANAPSVLHRNIQGKFKSAVTILFGLTPGDLEMPVNFPEFQVQAFDNCTFLHTPVLEILETDKVLKSKLWVCLRKIFGV